MNPKLYFLLALTAILAANVYGSVLDIDGNPIFRGSYFVLPVIRGQGGGLSLANLGGQQCAFDIIQESLEVHEGIPVKFSNWKPRVAFVPESEDLYIKTDIRPMICDQSTYWRVGEYDRERKQFFIVGRLKPEEEDDSFKSFFKIEKSGDYYKFVFGNSTSVSDGTKSSDVGIFVDENGVRRLALSDEPFLVMFKKAWFTETSSKTM